MNKITKNKRHKLHLFTVSLLIQFNVKIIHENQRGSRRIKVEFSPLRLLLFFFRIYTFGLIVGRDIKQRVTRCRFFLFFFFSFFFKIMELESGNKERIVEMSDIVRNQVVT